MMNSKLVLKPPYLTIICGKQGSGKSHAIEYSMRENYLSEGRFDYGIVFSNTAWEDGAWNFLPQSYVYEEFDETILENLMKLQRNNLSKNINTSAFVIFDDCLDDQDQWTCKSIKKLSTQLRHYNISMIISTQYVHAIPPRLRANSMFCLIFDVGSGIRELEAAYSAYGQRWKNYAEFKEFYYANTKDHKFIMYDKEQDEFLVYKCPAKIPPFTFKYNKFK